MSAITHGIRPPRPAPTSRPAAPPHPRRNHYHGERLIACHNPVLAEERARKRQTLLTATVLAPVLAAVAAGRLTGADAIGMRVGKTDGK